MKKHKVIFSLCLVLFLTISQSVACFAADNPQLYGEIEYNEASHLLALKINIKNNPGIMGFKITLNYDYKLLTDPAVTKGPVLQNGMLNDSIGVTENGKADIVWSGTDGVQSDGNLFTVTFRCEKLTDTEIKLSYSQQDTFNSSFEDMVLECTDVIISADSDSTRLSGNTATQSDDTSETQAPDDKIIINVVDTVLQNHKTANINKLPESEQEAVVKESNEILNTVYDLPQQQYTDFNQLKTDYENKVADEYVKSTLESVDSQVITEIIDNSLKAVGAKTVEDVSAEKSEEFVSLVENEISENAPDLVPVSDKLNTEKVLKTISELESKSIEAFASGTKLPEKKTNARPIITVGIICATLLFMIVLIAINKMKHRR